MFYRKIKNSFRFALLKVRFKKCVENFARIHSEYGVGKNKDELFIDYMAFYEEIVSSFVRSINMVFKLDWYAELSGLSDSEIIKKVRNYEKSQENKINKLSKSIL